MGENITGYKRYLLTVRPGTGGVRHYEFDSLPAVIGRGITSHVQLLDEAVSREHARIEADGNDIYIIDLGSTNGTLLNGTPVARALLGPADVIKIGDALITFAEGKAPARAEKPELVPDRQKFETITVRLEKRISDLPAEARTRQCLATLYEISDLIVSDRPLTEVIQKILDIVFDITDADTGLVMLPRDEDSELECCASRKKDGTPGISASKTIIEEALESRKAVLTLNAPSDERFRRRESIIARGIGSAICAPLAGRHSVTGVIYLDRKMTSAPFKQADLELVAAVSRETGITVENAKLYRDLKRNYEELEKAHARLVAVEKTKSDFVGVMGHELYTPLSTVRLYLSLLKDAKTSTTDAETLSFLTIIDENLQRLSRIGREVIDAASLNGQAPVMKKQRFSLNSLLSAVHLEMQPLCISRNQQMKLVLPEDGLEIYGNEESIRQVLVNMTTNAVRFTPDGGRIEINAARSGDLARVEVTDTGVGIPQAEVENIFESFYCLHDPLSHHSGTVEFMSGGLGLGLTIAKRIVEAHNGRIWVETPVSKSPDSPGSRFVFTIPMQTPVV